MADVKISDLPASPLTLTTGALFPTVDGSPAATYKTSLTNVINSFPIASGSDKGLLSSANWTTFNNKIDGSGTTNQVPYWTVSGTLSANDGLVYIPANRVLGVGTTPLTNTQLYVYNENGVSLIRTVNNNSGDNMNFGTEIGSIEFNGRRNNTVSQASAKIVATYLGGGTTRVAKLDIGVAEDQASNYGNPNMALTCIGTTKTVVMGSLVDNYSATYPSTTITTAYTQKAQTVISGGGGAFPVVSFDVNGLSAAIVFGSGNFAVGTTTDSSFKADINGTLRVQERLTVSNDSTSAAQIASVITTDTANCSIIIRPTGTGALMTAVPVANSSTVGNVRGNNAVDWQTLRNAATQVASGANSVIGGGENNTAAGTHASVTGGFNNNAGTNYTAIAGGEACTVTSGTNIAIGGGRSNVATVGSPNFSVISGGQSNSVNAEHTVVAGGQGNGTYQAHSSILGGQQNAANSISSSILGSNARTQLRGQTAMAYTMFALSGDAQTSILRVRRISLNAAVVELTLDGNVPVVGNKLIPSLIAGTTSAGTTLNCRAWNARIDLIAIVNAVGSGTVILNDVYANSYSCVLKRTASNIAFVGSVSPGSAVGDVSMSTSSVAIGLDTTNYALTVTYTPPTGAATSTSIYVLATIYLTEILR